MDAGMNSIEISHVWDCLLELFDFPGCAQRRGVVCNVLLFNNFIRMEQLRGASDAGTWQDAQRLLPEEITFLNRLSVTVNEVHSGRYVRRTRC